jgi:hypothetical protein
MQLGERFSWEKDGVVYTDQVESVSYSSGSPPIYRNLNRWQRALRRITPPKRRNSLLVRGAESPSVAINAAGDPTGKTLAQIEELRQAAVHGGCG